MKKYRRRTRPQQFERNDKKKYNSNHTKNRCELVEKPKKQFNRIFIDKKLAIKLIIDCRTTMGHKFRTRLRFNKMSF